MPHEGLLLLLPRAGVVLNPPSRLGLIAPAIREDLLNVRHRFAAQLVGRRYLLIEGLAVSVLLLDEITRLPPFRKAQGPRVPYLEKARIALPDGALVVERLELGKAIFQRVLESPDCRGWRRLC